MRSRILLAVALALLLAPGAAQAAGGAISLDQYQERLRQVVNHLDAAARAGEAEAARPDLEAARKLVNGSWDVQTPEGTVTVDLRSLAALIERAEAGSGDGRALLARSRGLAEAQLEAAEAAGQATPVDLVAARRQLDLALATAEEKRTWYARLGDWLRGLFARTPLRAATSREAGPYWFWGSLILGSVGVILLGRGLILTLTGNAGGNTLALKGAGSGQPDRPRSPEELREEARALAAGGDYLAALRMAHLALLQHLDRLRLLRYAPSQTMREHERLLRRSYPAVARALRPLNELMESRLYSGSGATAEDFNRGEALVEEIWREGDAASKNRDGTTGASSPAPSS